jgi:hypothetical protein
MQGLHGSRIYKQRFDLNKVRHIQFRGNNHRDSDGIEGLPRWGRGIFLGIYWACKAESLSLEWLCYSFSSVVILYFFLWFLRYILKNWRHRLKKSLRYTSLEIDCQQIVRCIQIGLDYVKLDRLKRPTISQVIKMLHHETESAVQSHLTLILGQCVDDNQVLLVDLPATSVPFYFCDLVVVNGSCRWVQPGTFI